MAGTITVNDCAMPWHSGMTVADVLREARFVFPLLVVSLDGRLVPRADYDSVQVPDGSRVDVIHLMSGG